jgi:hypothetical protein
MEFPSKALKAAILALSGLVTLLAFMPSLAFADIVTVSDTLTITLPGMRPVSRMILEENEASLGLASTAYAFTANRGVYCIQANCLEGTTPDIPLKEPGDTADSDSVSAKIEFGLFGPDRITIILLSRVGSETGPDSGEMEDVTKKLFTKLPAGFSAVVDSTDRQIQAVAEPHSIWLLALVAICLASCRRRITKIFNIELNRQNVGL